MHCEKNLAINVLKTSLGEKDTKKVWHDLQACDIRPTVWLQPHPTRIGETTMPIAPWVMPKEEHLFFLDTLAKLNVPIGYTPRFKKHVKGKLKAMKSHDYHILCQKILPICMRHMMMWEPTVAILWICKIFQLICTKVYDPSTYHVLKVRTITTLRRYSLLVYLILKCTMQSI